MAATLRRGDVRPGAISLDAKPDKQALQHYREPQRLDLVEGPRQHPRHPSCGDRRIGRAHPGHAA